MIRRALIAAGMLLVLFHGWLLVDQVWAGALTDLALVARWVVAGGLLLALYGLRRQGAPVLWGRQAVALWLLAALLHGPAVAQRVSTTGEPVGPAVVATLVQVTLGTTLIVGLLSLGLLAVRRRRARQPATAVRSDHAFLGALSPDTYVLFAPRPPPLA
jgi:hypothetical protein